MKRRITIWASVGFLVGCGWVLYSFLTPPEQLIVIMSEPFIVALGYATCPLVFAARHLPLHFWWVPAINGITYALIGLVAEVLISLTQVGHKNPSPAI
jgi:hypothetical protein